MMLCCRNILRINHVSPASQKIALIAGSSYFPYNRTSKRISKRYLSVKASAGKNTVNEDEVGRFEQQADDWWDSKTFSILGAMNALRVPLVRDGILSLHSPPQQEKAAKPLKGFTILDVGCGGGLLSEPLARLGAKVTGLDPGAENIRVAQNHAELDGEIQNNLEYICGTVEDLSIENRKYDALVCSEVIEHVDNVDLFVKCCADLVDINGSLFFTTLNRTAFSYISTIFIAEYTLGIIPRGTHDWKKYIVPHDLKHLLQSHGCRTLLIHGMIYNPVCKSWSWSQYDGANYALHAVKESVVSNA